MPHPLNRRPRRRPSHAAAHECDERSHPHRSDPLSSTTIRLVHFILRAAYGKGVRWYWVGANSVLTMDAPGVQKPDPQPPSPEEAVRMVDEAWEDAERGTFVWLTMTTGARRGELCALRWSNVDLDRGVITRAVNNCYSITQGRLG